MKFKTPLTRSFLLEIGVEELPSDAIRLIRRELKGRVDHWLNEKNLLLEAPLRNLLEAEDSLQDIRVEVTPRRIVIFIEGLPVKQPDREEEIIGPSVQAALTTENEPTPALLGFLKAKGATLDDIFKKATPRGETVAVRIKKKGVATEKLLKSFTSEIFAGFQFPKTMKWNVGVNFPRPIRWILALWGPQVLPFEYADLKSGRLTYGHRFLAPRAISVRQADYRELETKLKKAHVTASFGSRAEKVREALLKTNPAEKIDEELIEISASLTEDISFIRGSFDKRFLKLPEKILATSMKKHQKIFALYEKDGSLRPHFLAVTNGGKKDPERIRKNYENVLEAKLKDAEFFYQEDRKTKLEEKLKSLKKVTFLGKLGTLFEKAERMLSLSEELAEELKLSEEERLQLERAALLSKADLVTHMVYEFPELQGFAGSEYAKLEGEPQAVASALKDYYLPLSSQTEDPLELEGITKESARKTRLTGALLGILDKLDTLVGASGIGLEVSGSQDPYALRRAANGIVLTVFEFKRRDLTELSFSLEKLINRAALLYGNKLKHTPQEIVPKLRKLFEERIQWILGTDRLRDKEFLAGIFNTSSDRLTEVWDKFAFLRSLEAKEPVLFREAHKIVERTRNILKGVKGPLPQDPVNPELLQTPEEKALFQAFSEIQDAFGREAAQGSYLEATKLYASALYDRISAFFDRVLVNVEDEVLRRNRLALMRDINSLYTRQIADLSPLTQMA